MNLNYYNFPFIQFCVLCHNEEKLSDYGLKKDDWDKIKEEYSNQHIDYKELQLVEAYKKVLHANIKRSKIVAVISYVLEINPDNWEECFKVAKLKYKGDYKKDSDFLNAQLQKEKTKEEIFTAQLNKLQAEIKEAKDNQIAESFDLKKVYKAIASFVKAGASIPDYEKLTCGEYDALTAVYADGR